MTIPDCAGFQPSNNTEEECEVVESRSVLQKDWLRTEDGASQPELTIDKLSARPTGPVWRREEKTGRTGNLQRALSQTLDLLAFADGSSPDLSLGLAQVSPVVEKCGGVLADGPNPDQYKTQN